jgi:5-methyltetrahydropteroyltriglutamate--homocysteine methyltransferase
MTEVIRADHVGSLLRPQSLLGARDAHQQGRLASEALRALEDQAILDVLELQRQAGVDVFTDGELRRSSWLSGLPDVLEGVALSGRRRMPDGAWQGPGAAEANAELPIASLAVVERIRPKRRFTGEEAAFLRANAPGPWKITMPSPTIQLNMFDPGSIDAVYRDRQGLLDDMVAIYRDEVDALVQQGPAYVQLDSLRYTQAISGFNPNGEAMTDPGAIVSQTIAADNAVLSRVRAAGVATGVHICRGNHRSAWVMSGGYDAIAERLLNEVETDRFLLEYDDERSGGFEPLRFLPKGRMVVLGLVTTKVGALEDADALARRIDEAARFAPLEQLALSPQCGFASTYKGNLLTQDDEKRKLELVARTARRVWG